MNLSNWHHLTWIRFVGKKIFSLVSGKLPCDLRNLLAMRWDGDTQGQSFSFYGSWPLQESHTRYPSHQAFTLWFITITKLQEWSSNRIHLWLGITKTWGTILKVAALRRERPSAAGKRIVGFKQCTSRRFQLLLTAAHGVCVKAQDQQSRMETSGTMVWIPLWTWTV